MASTYLAPRWNLSLHFVPSWTPMSQADREWLEQADIVIGQLVQFEAEASLAGLATRAIPVLVPLVSAGFLWPFGGRAHPRNEPTPLHPFGPYPAELGGSYLNRALAREADHETIIARYLALDVDQMVDLDRLLELGLEQQALRDEATGFDTTRFIANFRAQPIFRTPYHFESGLLAELAAQAFAKAGLGAEIADFLRTTMLPNPMQDVWLPVHPAVSRHFGLRYARPDQRYPYFDEGAFTFAEYARRYLRYEWNRPLQEGMQLSTRGRDAEAIPKLREGLLASPLSAKGQLCLSQSLVRSEGPQAGRAMAERAASVAPDDSRPHVHLAHLLAELRAVAELEPVARRGIALDPANAGLHAVLGSALSSRGEIAAALHCLRQAMLLNPRDADTRMFHAELLLQQQPGAAEVEFRALIAQDGTNARAHFGLSCALERLGQIDAALAALAPALATQPGDAGSLFQLAKLQALKGQGAAMQATYAALISEGAQYHAGFAQLFFEQGAIHCAIAAIERAVELEPTNQGTQDFRSWMPRLRGANAV